MRLTFAGGASEVGASCTLLEVAGHRLLIDGGIRPAAREGQSRLPDLALLDPIPPEVLLITHAHIDHTGALPLIASLYPHIPIYATESTRVLTEILLRDSVRIMEQEGLKPDGETPLYTADQVDALLGRIRPIGFHQPFAPISSAPNLSVSFLPAGHILGAAMLFFETTEGSLLHTGDISVTDQRTIKGLDVQHLPHADTMICEGTYGNRSHSNRKEEERKLAETVQSVVARGGRILCPAFAVGRAQEIVLILKAYRASGQISPVPIYLDGMVRSVCIAYQNQSHDLQPTLQRYLSNARRPLFADPDLHIFAVRSPERAALLQRKEPAVIISSSGMLTGGASPLYALEFAPREQDCLLFTGYQDEESPGAALLKAKQGAQLQIGGKSITLQCQVARYNLSGHADGDQIVHAVTRVAPKELILVHGASESLEALSRRFTNLHVAIPTVGTTLSVRSTTTIAASARQQVSRLPAELEPSFAHAEKANVGLCEQAIAPPTIEALWDMAFKKGPDRPWTAVELGQHYYGPAYRPAFRVEVEQILKEATPYFKQRRVGAQPIYLPRTPLETRQLRSISTLQPGEIVLVQGQQGGAPQIALLLSPSQEGTISLVADQWKEGARPLHVIQLVPAIQRAAMLQLTPVEARQQLRTWRQQLQEEWVDLIAWWRRCQGQPFTYTQLSSTLSTDDERLAWGLELLTHGEILFRQEGLTWTPRDEQYVLNNTGIAHHLELLHVGAGTHVQVNEQDAVLTGRSNWRLFEIQWQTGEKAGTLAHARAANIGH